MAVGIDYRQTANIAELLLLTFPFLLAVLGLGKLVTECLRSVEMIYLTLAFITTPIFYLSGTIWPLQSMPAWVRAISYSIPSTWGTKAIAGVNQMGLSLNEVWGDVDDDAGARRGLHPLGFGVGFAQQRSAARDVQEAAGGINKGAIFGAFIISYYRYV